VIYYYWLYTKFDHTGYYPTNYQPRKLYYRPWKGATTLGIMTFSITTISIITFSITTISIITFSITTISIITFSIIINKMRHSA
jgi:hypothetical protein